MLYYAHEEATADGKHVCAELYSISEKEFHGYIEALEKDGYLRTRTEDGVAHFDSTIKTPGYDKPEFSKIIPDLLALAVKLIGSFLIQ